MAEAMKKHGERIEIAECREGEAISREIWEHTVCGEYLPQHYEDEYYVQIRMLGCEDDRHYLQADKDHHGNIEINMCATENHTTSVFKVEQHGALLRFICQEGPCKGHVLCMEHKKLTVKKWRSAEISPLDIDSLFHVDIKDHDMTFTMKSCHKPQQFVNFNKKGRYILPSDILQNTSDIKYRQSYKLRVMKYFKVTRV